MLAFDPGRLRWADVAPTQPFDSALARRIATSVVEQAMADFAARGLRTEIAPDDDEHAIRNSDRDAVERAIDRALIGGYGAWACGWSWTATEPGGGGLLHVWCCSTHSVLPTLEWSGRDSDPIVVEAPRLTVERIVGAITEWRSVLDELADLFAGLPFERDAAASRCAEVAAAELLDYVVKRTEAADAWRHTLHTVLRWYLESKGLTFEAANRIASKAVSDRFASWCAPDASIANDMKADFARAASAESERLKAPSEDGTSNWLSHRDGIRREAAFLAEFLAGEQVPVTEDGHSRYIEGPERARDSERARRMASALTEARRWALSNAPLTFDELARWQTLVLGRAAEFRTADAFGKEGAERYPLQGAREAFERCLAETADRTLPPVSRAARAYLDICFLHPFDDGNGRAARLALDAILYRDGLGLHAVDPLVFSRSANSSTTYYFTRLVGYLSGRRADRS